MPFLLLALWLGLLTGFAEVIVRGLQYYVFHDFLILSHHTVWMAPLVDAALFAVWGAGLTLAHRISPKWFSWSRILGFLVFAGVLAVLIPISQLHPVAIVLLAAGIGVQASRRLQHRRTTIEGVARRSVTGFIVILIVVAGGMIWRDNADERRSLAGANLGAAAPNVLLIILDTVRAMNLSLYGYSRPTTPELSRWAAGGWVFERVISTAPWTLPSHASMFTGRFPHELAASWKTPLENGPPTLAEAFSSRGYATAGFVANARYAGRETGLARGFAHYEDYHITMGEALKSATLTNGIHKTIAKFLGLPPLRPRTGGSDINHWFLRWLDRRESDRPFFVFLNYLDAHDPYDPAAGFIARFAPNARRNRPRDGTLVTEERARGEMDLYDGAIGYLDSLVAGLLRELEGRGMLKNTIVILTSDHGEEFAEHGIMGHAASLHRPAVEVPLVISFPGNVPAGRSPGPITLRDLAATILDLSGKPEPDFPGRSLARYWSAPAAVPGTDTIISHIRKLINRPEWWPASQGDMFSVAVGRYRYIKNEGNGAEELFDFDTDRKEQQNLAESPVGARELPALRRAVQAFTRSAPRH
jgi:arylsulfatase A-like enzyme